MIMNGVLFFLLLPVPISMKHKQGKNAMFYEQVLPVQVTALSPCLFYNAKSWEHTREESNYNTHCSTMFFTVTAHRCQSCRQAHLM